MRAVTLGLALALALVPATARADDGLRCGQFIIRLGAHEYEVARKCGAPTDAATYPSCGADGMYDCVTLDVWTYDRGATEMVRTLSFANGVLAHVAVGDYGSP